MKIIISTIISLLLFACTTLVPVTSSPEELQQQITQNKIANIGDDVLIVTQDGKRYEFEVISKTATNLLGKKDNILISDIVTLETREISKGKTIMLAGGTYLIIQILAAIAAVMVLGG